ncbi:MAG: hypothetical protein AB7K41_09180, partial [Bdellovibrionales bacterium]
MSRLMMILLMILALTSSSSLAKSPSDADCDSALTQARQQAATLGSRVLIRAPQPPVAHPDSMSARLNLKVVNDEWLDAPRAAGLNEAFGLQHGVSPIYFIEIDVKKVTRPNFPGDIEEDFYHFLLVHGYVGITNPDGGPDQVNSFLHDLGDHSASYVILSRSPMWPVAIRILKEARIIQRKYQHTRPTISTLAEDMKKDIALLFEIKTGQISVRDRGNYSS